jgi:hypothetical protein
MSTLSADNRAQLGCVFEPVLVQATPWSPLALNPAWKGIDGKGEPPTVCPGYTTTLPDVVEVARGRVHWQKNSLRDFCGGAPNEQMLALIELLEGETNEVDRWHLENARTQGDS